MHRSLLLPLLFAAAGVFADVTLPAIISDHMVVQADMAAPIFGTAAPGEQVTVEINGQKKTGAADKDGKWLIKLDPQKAGGPFELKIAGKNSIAIKDVMVGEVWLASGQSNMRFPLNKTTDGAADIAKADNPRIRYVMNTGKWAVSSPAIAPNFSGVAYYFAASLQPKLNVTIGIVENSVSGAVAQRFVRKEALAADPALMEVLKIHGAADPEIVMSDIWNDAFVPIVPYGIRGALWYQGEGNRDFPVTYRKLLATLIGDWRKQWGEGDFPFLIVQLANWQQQKPEPWEGKDCALRESQLKTLDTVKNTALTVTIDLGILDVHYPNKKPVGERLAIAARGMVYGEKIEISGPIFDAAKFDGGKATVTFKHTGAGLSAKGDKLTGFLLCGADKKFVRADAAIEGDKVIVSTAAVPAPVAVRYAWERNPPCNLYNKDGLPASPFRSDTFENYATRDNNANDK